MANSDIEKFRELISPRAIILPETDKSGQNIVELRELQEKDSVIWIKGVPEESIIFNLDDFFPAPDQIFAGSKSECCRSDYVIVSNANVEKNIVFIEMKSDYDDDYAHMKNQLRGAYSFMGYCQTILDAFWKYTFSFDKYDKHYVICTRTSKKWTKKFDRNQPANTDVENPLKLEGSNQYPFNRLIGRKPR